MNIIHPTISVVVIHNYNLYGGCMRQIFRMLFALVLLPGASFVLAQESNEVPPFPNDMSVSGLQALTSGTGDSTIINSVIAPEVLDRLREYVKETRQLGLESRTGRFTIATSPTNVHVNNNTGDRVGETQAEVAVAVFGDTVVVGFNDSRGFTVGA